LKLKQALGKIGKLMTKLKLVLLERCGMAEVHLLRSIETIEELQSKILFHVSQFRGLSSSIFGGEDCLQLGGFLDPLLESAGLVKALQSSYSAIVLSQFVIF
jgi:hypothetical protein